MQNLAEKGKKFKISIIALAQVSVFWYLTISVTQPLKNRKRWAKNVDYTREWQTRAGSNLLLIAQNWQ